MFIPQLVVVALIVISAKAAGCRFVTNAACGDIIQCPEGLPATTNGPCPNGFGDQSKCWKSEDSCADFPMSPPADNSECLNSYPNAGCEWTRFPYETCAGWDACLNNEVNLKCWGSCACNIAGLNCDACGYCGKTSGGSNGGCGYSSEQDNPIATTCPTDIFDRRLSDTGEYGEDDAEEDELTKDYNMYMAMTDDEKRMHFSTLYCGLGYVLTTNEFHTLIEDFVDTNNDGKVSIDEFDTHDNYGFDISSEHCKPALSHIADLERTCANEKSNPSLSSGKGGKKKKKRKNKVHNTFE